MLEIVKGRTYELMQTLLDTVEGPDSDMSHIATTKCQMRTKGNNELVVTLASSLVGSVIKVSLTAEQTKLLEVGDYVIDIVGTTVNSKHESLMDPEAIRVVNRPTNPNTDPVLMQVFASEEPTLMGIGKSTGWLPQPDDFRDYPLKMLLSAVNTPSAYELRDMSPVRNQQSIGSCVGFATCAAVEHLRRVLTEDHWETIYSPLFTYYLAREAIGYTQYDSGSYIRDAVKSLAKIGAAREADWMYYEIHHKFREYPSERAFKSAQSWKLAGYYLCRTIQDVKKAISSGYPVVGGFTCYSNLGQSSGGVIPLPSGSVIGGHAVLFMGYDDNLRHVKFKNSWGPDWGDNGYGYLPYDYFESGLASDLWALEGELK